MTAKRLTVSDQSADRLWSRCWLVLNSTCWLMKRLIWEENENGISFFTTNSINIQSSFLSWILTFDSRKCSNTLDEYLSKLISIKQNLSNNIYWTGTILKIYVSSFKFQNNPLKQDITISVVRDEESYTYKRWEPRYIWLQSLCSKILCI